MVATMFARARPVQQAIHLEIQSVGDFTNGRRTTRWLL